MRISLIFSCNNSVVALPVVPMEGTLHFDNSTPFYYQSKNHVKKINYDTVNESKRTNASGLNPGKSDDGHHNFNSFAMRKSIAKLR